LRNIVPLTTNQHRTFDFYENGKNLVLHGYAGTGKTFISLFLALNEILTPGSRYDKIIIVRSVVPSRDIGFLPGSIKDKIRVYEEPYSEIVDDLFGRSEYDAMKLRGIIQFTTTSFLRGLTFNNAIVIVDEAQNLEFHELYTTITRLGDHSRLLMIGDFRQTDLQKGKTALMPIISILKSMSSVSFVEFEKEDIVRSDFVREFIIKSAEYTL
jgi:phosphate starvation-inducible protein PhoH